MCRLPKVRRSTVHAASDQVGSLASLTRRARATCAARVAKLEVQMTHLSEKLDDPHKKVEEMHAILLQAKGARWVIVGMAGVAGLASGLIAKLMPWSGAWPR